MDLTRGQRIKLENLVSSDKFTVGVTIKTSLTIDYSCFGLDSEDRLSDERYMTFYNQPETPCKAVCLENKYREDDTGFVVDLSRLPNSIQKIVITAAIDGRGVMSEIKRGHVRLIEYGIPVMQFFIQGCDFDKERALMLIEIYKKNDQWRIHGLGQGFNGGLDSLVKHFGAEIAEPSSISEESLSIQQGADLGGDLVESKNEEDSNINGGKNNGNICIRCHRKVGIVGRFLGYNIRRR